MNRFFAALTAWAFLIACMGGSDGVENPKLDLRFEPAFGTAAAGRISLYSGNLDPAGDSLPLLVKDFAGRTPVSVTPEEMDSAIALELGRRGLDPAGGEGGWTDTALDFNVVASNAELEAWVPGFRYSRRGNRAGFARTVPGAAPEQEAYGSVSVTHPLPKAVMDFRGRIGLAGAALGIDYVFIPGSPYFARVDSNQAVAFMRLPSGIFGLVGADRDSSLYFGAADSLDTEDSAYVAKAWDAIIFIR